MSIHRCRPVKARTGGRKSGPRHPSWWKVGNEDVHYSIVYNSKAGNIMPVFEGTFRGLAVHSWCSSLEAGHWRMNI